MFAIKICSNCFSKKVLVLLFRLNFLVGAILNNSGVSGLLELPTVLTQKAFVDRAIVTHHNYSRRRSAENLKTKVGSFKTFLFRLQTIS